MANTIPTVIEKQGSKDIFYDLFSRLLSDRIIFIGSPITDELAEVIIGELLYLDADDSNSQIQIYLNTPGGSVNAGLAIIDTMRHIKSPITAVVIGMAASMGVGILAAADLRFSLKNSTIMMHQALTKLDGNVHDLRIAMGALEQANSKVKDIIIDNTYLTEEEFEQITIRDKYLTAEEAFKIGLIDKILDDVKTPEREPRPKNFNIDFLNVK